MEKSIIVLALVTLCFGISVVTKDDLTLLESEARQTSSIFQKAWQNSKKDMYKNKGVKKYRERLSEAEMRIIIAYTYENPRFYRELNTDLRNNDGNVSKNKYSQATRVLTTALKKLRELQQIPRTLYRKEDSHKVIPMYMKVRKNRNIGKLMQFTSTCGGTKEQAEKFERGDMLTTLNDMPAGAYIKAFSKYPKECEVLLPPNLYYRVDSINGKTAVISAISSCAVNISNISLYLSVTIVIFMFGPN